MARPEAAPAPAPTGIDYLGLVAERREAEIARRPSATPSWSLPGDGASRRDRTVAGFEPGITAIDDQDYQDEARTPRSADDHRPAPGPLGLLPHALREGPRTVDALWPPVPRRGRRTDRLRVSRSGCIGIITGEVGAGKTVAVRAGALGPRREPHTVVYLGNPSVGLGPLRHHRHEPRGQPRGFHRASLIPQAAESLATEEAERGREVVLVLDEAHLLDSEQLEGLRLLTNVDMDSRSPFACLLVGQPTLRRRIRLGAFAALDQRVALRYAITGMDQSRDRRLRGPPPAARRALRHAVLRRRARAHPPGVPGTATRPSTTWRSSPSSPPSPTNKAIVDESSARAAVTEVVAE